MTRTIRTTLMAAGFIGMLSVGQAVEKELAKRVAGNKPAFEELHVAAMLRGKAQTSRAAARSS